MEKTVLSVPKMWADHHVLKVREVLTALDGVEDVYASSAWKQVVVNYDPDKLTRLPSSKRWQELAMGRMERMESGRAALSAGDPRGMSSGVRVTKTNERDLELSGDFRRY